MPIVDGLFVARTPLCLAEQTVDFEELNRHVLERRRIVEKACQPAATRAANAYADLWIRPALHLIELAEKLERSLMATARFGFRSARAEVRELRARGKHHAQAAYAVPGAGRYAELARLGLLGIATLIAFRSQESARSVGDRIELASSEEPDVVLRGAALAAAAHRELHNHVLELVGETLNMGRTAGVLALSKPPTFAMRSEQLDKTMCSPCGFLHGEIYEVGSGDFYANLPPTGCLGGGRCRGIMVFGDGPLDVRAPEPSEEELARIRRPRRRAA